jgi:hypothetical protein
MRHRPWLPGLAAIALALAFGEVVRGTQTRIDLDSVVRRAGEYVKDYQDRLSTIVAEERYVQRSWLNFSDAGPGRDRGPRPDERVLRSDVMFIRGYVGEDSWIGVREVFEIDGKPADHERGHLRALLMDTSRPIAVRLRALADQQAKYNLGTLYRTINVPNSALQFVRPDHQWRVRYKNAGAAEFHGIQAWRVEFNERERPTLIRTPEGQSVRSNGVFWIDPQTGAVLRTELHAGEDKRRGFRSVIIVSYRRDDRFDMLVPDDMNELYIAGPRRIEAHATYSNFRRFETDTRIR